jgi:RNA polymerase sigma factor (sigma-70 family)
VEEGPLDETDEKLIARARRGDVVAFEEVVRRYQEIAFRVAYTITASAADAEDATQEGFIRAFRAVDRFREGESLRPWLLTIVANVARTRRSAVSRHPTLALSVVVAAAADAAPSPEAVALAAERRRELQTAVANLADTDREVIAYRYFLELSEAETAALLGCARGTVKSRLSRALVRLRQRLTMDETDASPEVSDQGGRDD